MSSVFSSQDQFCPFWDQFCGFAYIIRLGDHFCLGITFAAVQGSLIFSVLPKLDGNTHQDVKVMTIQKTEHLFLRLIWWRPCWLATVKMPTSPFSHITKQKIFELLRPITHKPLIQMISNLTSN